MSLAYHARNAATAERNRRRIAREGTNMRGDRVWTSAEDEVIRTLYPSYKEIMKALGNRTFEACKHRAKVLGIARVRRAITARELSIIRRMYPDRAKDEILACLPGRSWYSVLRIASDHKIRRKPKPFKPTGVLVLDQIRARCRELNYSMPDLDKLTKTKNYFKKGRWAMGHVHHRAIGRAVHALFGDLRADWK